MAYLRPGDTVRCKIRDGLIVSPEEHGFDAIETFEVVCLFEEGFIIKVPTRTHLKSSFEVTPRKCKEYQIPARFVDAQVQFINSSHISQVSDRRDGECCDRCKDFFQYAQRADDGTFRCFLCKTYKHR